MPQHLRLYHEREREARSRVVRRHPPLDVFPQLRMPVHRDKQFAQMRRLPQQRSNLASVFSDLVKVGLSGKVVVEVT